MAFQRKSLKCFVNVMLICTVAPGAAKLCRIVCKHSPLLLIANIMIFIFVQLLFGDYRSFISRKLYIDLETFIIFLHQHGYGMRLRCSTSTEYFVEENEGRN